MAKKRMSYRVPVKKLADFSKLSIPNESLDSTEAAVSGWRQFFKDNSCLKVNSCSEKKEILASALVLCRRLGVDGRESGVVEIGVKRRAGGYKIIVNQEV